MRTIRWGILGTGKIAKKFARDLALVKDAECAAVGSRTAGAAEAFAGEFSFSRAHGSYKALAEDPAVDAVYIATPHPMHAENAILCMKNGKAVLCEKPFAVNVKQVRSMISAARKYDCFLMEAMWSRFIPVMMKFKERISSGAIGDIRMLTADFGFRAAFDPKSRLFSPRLAGGALLDVGVYPVWLSHLVLGAPDTIIAAGSMAKTGVDESNAIIFRYKNGALALLHSAVNAVTIHEAFVSGTMGELRLHAPWWRTTKLTHVNDGKIVESWEFPLTGIGYSHEIMHVNDMLRAGSKESDILPLDLSLSVMRTLDAVRRKLGVRYPLEG